MSKLAAFPLRFLQIAEAAARRHPVAPLDCPDEKAAISTRHMFNRFRRALTLEQHPFSIAANDLIVRIQGTQIQFQARGLVAIGEVEASVQVPGLDQVAGDMAAITPPSAPSTPLVGEDSVDAALRGIMGLPKNES